MKDMINKLELPEYEMKKFTISQLEELIKCPVFSIMCRHTAVEVLAARRKINSDKRKLDHRKLLLLYLNENINDVNEFAATIINSANEIYSDSKFMEALKKEFGFEFNPNPAATVPVKDDCCTNHNHDKGVN